MITEIKAEDKVSIFMDLPESALGKLVDWERNNAFGIELSYSRVCHHCGHRDEFEVPMSSLF
jgi:hypothetical protein